MADDEAAKIIARLAAEAEFVDAGAFTLDPAAARRKLREHQLASAGAWALLLVEVGELLGVERIEVREGLRAIRVRLRGEGIERLAALDQLDMLFAWAFAPRDAAQAQLDADVVEARRLLALAVNAVVDRAVELRVTTRERGVRLRFDETSTQRTAARGGRPALVVKVGVALRRDLVQPADALVETARRAGYGRVPVYVAGRRIVGDVPLADACLASRPLLLEGREIGRVGLRLQTPGRPCIVFAPHGVRQQAIDAGGPDSAFFALVTRGLDRDLALSSIVVNDAYRRVRGAIAAAQAEFAAFEATIPSINESVAIGSASPEVTVSLLRMTSAALALCATIGVVFTLLRSGLLTGGTLVVIILAALLSPLSWLGSIHVRRRQALFLPKPSLTAKEEQLFFGDPTPKGTPRSSSHHSRIGR